LEIIAHMKEMINARAILVRMSEREFHLEDSSIDKNGNAILSMVRLVP
jgi:hypothetical protein